MIITSINKNLIPNRTLIGKILRVSMIIASGFIFFWVASGLKQNAISIAMAITWIALTSMIDRSIREKR